MINYSIIQLHQRAQLPEKELANSMKKKIEERIESYNQTRNNIKHTLQNKQAALNDYKISLQETLTKAQAEQLHFEEQLKKSDEQLLAKANEQLEQSMKELQLFIKQHQATIKRLKKQIPDKTTLIVIQKLQFKIKKLEKKLTNKQNQLSQPKEELLKIYKNDLEKHQIEAQKAIEDIRKKFKADEQTLLKQIENIYERKLKAIKKKQAEVTKSLSLNTAELADMAKREIEREIIDLKLQRIEAQCRNKKEKEQ